MCYAQLLGWHLKQRSALLTDTSPKSSMHQRVGKRPEANANPIGISLEPSVNGLAKGKIHRKPWFLPSNIGLSCKFSHHPIL